MVNFKQFDIVPNPSKISVKSYPFLIILQSDFLYQLDTIVVAPLMPIGKSPPVRLKLNPVLEIDGMHFQLMPELLASMSRKLLRAAVSNQASRQDEIRDALDFLLTGF
jgi:toxin CcdB